jgi:YVTN family beta-propeller protein
VRLSPDQRYAYVACDISNACEVYDLQTLTQARTISNFPIFLSTYSWNSENGRNAFTFSDFKVTPDGSHLILPDGRDSIFFYDAVTGAIDDTLTGVGQSRFIELSGDGATAMFVSEANPCVANQLDLATHDILASVPITGHSLMTFEAAMNMDGSKAYLGVSNNQSALVRFATNDFITFSQTYTAFWVGDSPDRTKAISGQYNFSIVDFATEQVLGTASGYSQSVGAVSPFGSRAIGYDPHRHEGLYFYDYTDPAPAYRGTTVAGQAPEGDCPYRVAITPDGSKAVVANVLSDNASIIDLTSYSVDTILPIGDRCRDIAITSDSRWAVVCGMNANSAVIIDLQDNSIAAEVPTNTGSATVSLSPGDTLAWVGNIGGNTVTKIRLDGAASYVVDDIPVGEIGLVWAAFGVPSDVRVTPDGRYVLVAVSFNDQVQVIDAETDQIVATLDVGDFPLTFACDSTGEFTTVTNYLGNTISALHVQGESSEVITSIGRGQGPLRAAYDPTQDDIVVGNYSARTLVGLDPHTGGQNWLTSFSSYGALTDVKIAEDGEPIVLTGGVGDFAGHLHRGADHIVLPAAPTMLDYCPAAHKALVAMPGPDWVTVVDWSSSASPEVVTIPLGAQPHLNVPRFVAGPTRISYSLPNAGRVRLELFSTDGRRVATLVSGRASAGEHAVILDASSLAAGTYVCRLHVAGRVVSRQFARLK